MNLWYVSAAVLSFLLGLAHSWLGERLILIRLFRRDNIPRLFGSDVFTKRTLRFAWHLTTVLLWGAAAILIVLAVGPGDASSRLVARILAVMFAVSCVVSLFGSRGKHFSWYVFLAISVLVWLG